jgi:serine phosphatase RsbU (regulator of sigma subunit)
MSLRLRLVVAFFLLSVVPLAAVTLYSYNSNVKAMREAAGHAAELLADELTQRMQIVTAQLGQRVERLMDISAAEQPLQTTATTAGEATAGQTGSGLATPAPSVAAASAVTVATDPTGTQQFAAALGDLSMLLNNVELRGIRGRGGRRFGGPGSRPAPPPAVAPTPPAPGAPEAVDQNRQAPADAPNAVEPPAAPPIDVGDAATPAAVPPSGPGRSQPFGGGRFRGNPSRNPGEGQNGEMESGPGRSSDGSAPAGRPPFPPGAPRIGAPGGPPEPANADPNRIRIDLGPIRDEVVRQFVPDGRWDQLSAEERQRVFSEVNQRMLGIQQGFQMLQAKVAELAAGAKTQPLADATVTPAPDTRAAPAPAAPATAPAASKAAAAPAAVSTRTQRRTEISGSRLNVRLEQNGEVVGQANAEINLPNLLATVFTSTRRDRGEVPFAVAKDGHLYTPTEADKQTIEGLGTSASQPDTAPGTTVLPRWIVVTTADPTGSGLKFGIARPVGEALADLQRTTARNAGFGLGFIGLALIGIVPLSSRLTRNLSSLSEGVRRIAQGEYHARVEVRSHDEVGRLAQAFNQMAADVEAHQRSVVEQERIRRELELGRQIQHDMLPQVPLRLGLTEVKGVSVPAREVGGDFFNYFQLANGTIALLVGDVSGKGVGAALLMANIQASLRTRLALGQDLAALARELDRDIDGSTPGPVYATLFVGILDPVTRVLRCVNAGHNPQYVLRQGRGLERMESTGLPIGLLSGRGYVEQRMQLGAGDLLFFYTDGCVEADNAAGEMFGPERLEHILASVAGASADSVLAEVETAVTEFRAGHELFDDATMMVVKVG